MTHLALTLAPLLEQAGSSGTSGPGGMPGACGGGSPMLLTMALVFGIFYFLIIRPGQKREKERQAMLQAIAPGDTVVTTGGLVGKVTGTSERYIVMEISPKVRVRVLRTNIAGKEEPEDGQKKAGKKSKGKKKDGDQGKGRKSSSTSDNKSDADDA